MVTEPYSHLPKHEFENLEEAVSTAAVSVYIGPVYCANVYKRSETKCWFGIASYVSLINHLMPTGHYMYHQFNIQQFHVLPTQSIYVFCVDLRTNSDYFPIQH